MRVEMHVNNRKFDLHCPACGGSAFYIPKSFERDGLFDRWVRCRKCKLDVSNDDAPNVLRIVMEDEIID